MRDPKPYSYTDMEALAFFRWVVLEAFSSLQQAFISPDERECRLDGNEGGLDQRPAHDWENGE
jgi:hypothetical protein